MKYLFAILIGSLFPFMGISQNPLLANNQLKFRLNEDGSHYVRLTFLNQLWVRHTETNPGSTVFGEPVKDVFDIGLRRTRLQLFGQLTDKVFFYTQFGQNNFSYLTKKYSGSFFHDAIVEYSVVDRNLTVGGGLTGWSGLSRYASPSIGKILSLDAPLYQQATNGVSDQFLRKLSVYAKGKLGKLDYRVALTQPMAVQNATATINPVSDISDFSTSPPKLQSQGYFMYQFLEEEANTTPYTPGTYLGTKKVFNIGAGFIYQPDALWHLNGTDTVIKPMILFGFDVFYDTPLNEERGNALTVYASYHRFNFGPNYVRNVGVMNPANGTNGNGTFNGAGDAFPMIGTGDVLYAQIGYLLKKDLLPNHGSLQPYFATQYADYDRLSDPMLMMEGGVNWYINGTHGSKITFNYQNRPVYKLQPSGSISETQRKGMYQLQYQISF